MQMFKLELEQTKAVKLDAKIQWFHVIYGEERGQNIKLKLNELTKHKKMSFSTSGFKILLEGNEEKVCKGQREPVKGKFLHADFEEFQEKLS